MWAIPISNTHEAEHEHAKGGCQELTTDLSVFHEQNSPD